MGMTSTISNAMSGLKTTEAGLAVVARNVANAGTPGYHRQDLALSDVVGANSSSARILAVQRAFSEAIQAQINTESGRAGYTGAMADFLGRLELQFGKPGDANSLDSVFADFEAGLTTLTANPEDNATRSSFLADAQALIGTIRHLSESIQTLRADADGRAAGYVNDLNQSLYQLKEINDRLGASAPGDAAHNALLDERDRLINNISGIVDIRVTYQQNGSVRVSTESGLGLLDGKVTPLEFEPTGSFSPGLSLEEGNVGTLYAKVGSGSKIDLLSSAVLRGGALKALFDLRDDTLNVAQAQLDEIASALALAMSTVTEQGSAFSDVTGDGFELDIGNVLAGNDVVLNYTENGTEKTVRVIRIDDPANLPLDQTDPNGVRTIGLDFSGGASSVAAALQTALGPGLQISSPGGDTLRILDDGAGATTDINALNARVTATEATGQGLGLPLFLDGTGAYTNALDGNGQKQGLAGRIRLNPEILANNGLLSQYDTGIGLGDETRAVYLLDQLRDVRTDVSASSNFGRSGYQSSGTVQSLIAQTLDYQGNTIAGARNAETAQNLITSSLQERAASATDVDVDQEMARLMELQTAYAANARVITIAKELMDTLFAVI